MTYLWIIVLGVLGNRITTFTVAAIGTMFDEDGGRRDHPKM